MLIWNFVLMLVWCALFGDFAVKNLVGGFVLGYFVLSLLASRGVVGSPRYVRRVRRIVSFAGFFLTELAIANVRVARDVITPGIRSRPAIVAVPLEDLTDAEVTLLATLVTLTPGTMSLDVSSDRRTLYVHVMDLPGGDASRFVSSLKRGFEARVLEATR
ncbi:MAG: Na+/H+ antiporter subunit E [Fimbriimonadaceae bacterium]|nr:Na+/H+ antiporter subunit E [Fimbriimonadaceae bacterium]